MKLSDILGGDFFNTHIKSGIIYHFIYKIYTIISSLSNPLLGNVMMLSEGRPGIDDLYTLIDGTLVL